MDAVRENKIVNHFDDFSVTENQSDQSEEASGNYGVLQVCIQNSVIRMLVCRQDVNAVNKKEIIKTDVEKKTGGYSSEQGFLVKIISVSSFFKRCVESNKSDGGIQTQVSDEFQYFADTDEFMQRLPEDEYVKRFMASSKYVDEVKALFESVKYVANHHKLYDRHDSNLVTRLLVENISDSDQEITDCNILKDILRSHNIKLADTNNKEIKISLTPEESGLFQFVPLAKCYRLSNLLGGLVAVVSSICSELQSQSDSLASEKMTEIKKQINDVQNLTHGLAHSLLKAQMSEGFRDDIYTPLKITDENGHTLFRSDAFQPRGGWKDSAYG